MAMGIVSDSDFKKELEKSSPDKSESVKIKKEAEIIDVNRGRGNNPEVPESLRRLIGEESAINGRQSALELAQGFGISGSSVSAYANGSTSTATYDKQPNLTHLNKARERVSKRARNTLMRALSHITATKLEAANAKDLSGVAKDMSAIIRTMEPETPKSGEGINNNGPTFIFYSPQPRREDSYETVYAKE